MSEEQIVFLGFAIILAIPFLLWIRAHRAEVRTADIRRKAELSVRQTQGWYINRGEEMFFVNTPAEVLELLRTGRLLESDSLFGPDSVSWTRVAEATWLTGSPLRATVRRESFFGAAANLAYVLWVLFLVYVAPVIGFFAAVYGLVRFVKWAWSQ